MKTTGTLLALILTTALPAADQSNAPAPEATPKPAAEAPPKLPPQVTQVVTDQLPKYVPPAPAKPEPAPNPDVMVLPKMTVTQKKRPRLGDNVMMTTKAFNDKLAKEKLSSLDRDFLNRFTLPAWFGGISAAERARAEYDYEKKEELIADVFNLARVVEVEDPAQAKALRDAVSKP